MSQHTAEILFMLGGYDLECRGEISVKVSIGENIKFVVIIS